ncbi:hypothetical protein PF005_g33298 [Phytophthora fragariae]|uniref:Uncharacterized protein n=2 Tax=Phytophthora TaxID=4783 RepID=A0A6A3Q8S2_9STRA|nr:hypothetical protein PF003_g18633 [Phytophthora fragariae]KAE8968212.1 hypothetical protein PR001_g27862 [Phytophthora rubi]KAE9071416.1 hypothetical protein PF007_g26567 [Phytophthora fragariae]KAE9156229.1 hypothetical protein PF005_g33298 [Phytophthora fragariae]KAE9260585.1 hypothetical protein PF008_g33065 [Phytophthora fragariae]
MSNSRRKSEHHVPKALSFACASSVARGASTASMGASGPTLKMRKYDVIMMSPVAALACRSGTDTVAPLLSSSD